MKTLTILSIPSSKISPWSLDKISTFITVPAWPCFTFNEVSCKLASRAEPKITAINFSSGVGLYSPFGEALPTKISPAETSEPTTTIPFSSKNLLEVVEALGTSFVNISFPVLEVLNWIVCSSIWIEVKTSSLTSLSLIMIASSKLYPFHVEKATNKFLPKAISPSLNEEPSVKISSFLTTSPNFTIGFWWINVPWFDFSNCLKL